MNNEPVAWGMLDKDGGIYDTICPEEHDREEGAYTIPLYTHPAKTLTDEEIDSVIHELRQKSFDPKRWVDVYTIAIETIIQLRDELAILKKASEK